jgi:hypothetical protein
VVTVGVAVTVPPVVALSPVPGLQLYVLAPLAFREVEPPTHIDGEFTVTVGNGFTVTTAVVVPVHAPEAAVIV